MRKCECLGKGSLPWLVTGPGTTVAFQDVIKLICCLFATCKLLVSLFFAVNGLRWPGSPRSVFGNQFLNCSHVVRLNTTLFAFNSLFTYCLQFVHCVLGVHGLLSEFKFKFTLLQINTSRAWSRPMLACPLIRPFFSASFELFSILYEPSNQKAFFPVLMYVISYCIYNVTLM